MDNFGARQALICLIYLAILTDEEIERQEKKLLNIILRISDKS